MSTQNNTAPQHISRDTAGMSARNVRRTLIAAGLGALSVGASFVLGAGKANAEPFSNIDHQHDMAVMCTAISGNPSFGELDYIRDAWVGRAHYGSDDSWALLGAQTLMDAVQYDCPQFTSLLRAWAVYGGTNNTTTGGTVA